MSTHTLDLYNHTFRLDISLGGAGMSNGVDLGRALRETAEMVDANEQTGTLTNPDGHDVGGYRIWEGSEADDPSRSTQKGFRLAIDLGNAEMLETAHVIDELRAVADRLEQFGPTTEGVCTDVNGNTVGSYSLVLPEPPTEQVSAINVQAGQRIKIGDVFERVEEDAAIMPGDRVEIITEPYSEGVLWESNKQVEVLIEEEG